MFYLSRQLLYSTSRYQTESIFNKNREYYRILCILFKNNSRKQMPLLKSLLMSMKNHQSYDPICDDGSENRIILHKDEAFQQGIHFKIKLIGSLEVTKPTSRGEIITAMRRIRHEFKARSVKKRPIDLSISVDGIKVSLWKKNVEYNPTILMQHPIYRVFYVSHDSQDLKIFSFIARDNTSNTFRCHVFKAYKKNEAIHIVRTIGQAFDVCHKLSLQQNHLSTEISEKPERYLQSVQLPTTSSEFTLKHQMQFMQEQFQQMQNESELTLNQMKIVKEQLNVEIAARIDAQNKTKQLIERNRELLIHIQQLLVYTHELEIKLNQHIEPFQKLPSRPINLHLHPNLFSTLTKQELSSDSPDSGKGKEISSENLSETLLTSIHDQQITQTNDCPSRIDDLTTRSISINENTSKMTKNCEEYSSTATSCSSINQHPIENYLYDHILPISCTSSFTNTAFTDSPLRKMK